MAVIDKLREGATLTRACRQVGGIAASTVKAHCKQHEELQKLFDEALIEADDMMAEALAEPDSHLLYGSTNPAMASVISSNLKWLLSRRRPEKYGDKVTVKTEGGVDAAIVTALQEAIKRIPIPQQGDNARVIDMMPAHLLIEDARVLDDEVDPADLF